jgi:hypothetical protein
LSCFYCRSSTRLFSVSRVLLLFIFIAICQP